MKSFLPTCQSFNASFLPKTEKNIFFSLTLVSLPIHITTQHSALHTTVQPKGWQLPANKDHLQNTRARPSIDAASINELVPSATQSHVQMSPTQSSCVLVGTGETELFFFYVLACSSHTVE